MYYILDPGPLAVATGDLSDSCQKILTSKTGKKPGLKKYSAGGFETSSPPFKCHSTSNNFKLNWLKSKGTVESYYHKMQSN